MSPPASSSEPARNPDQGRWFAEEVQPHEPALRGYLRHKFPSLDTDDLLQESYLRIFQTHAAGRVASAKSYVFSVARNTARRLFQRRRKLYSETPVNELPDWRVIEGGPDAADITNTAQRLELVADAVDSLPARCREIFTLAIVDGLTSREIAHRLGLSENTVRVQLARGVRKCADFLREKGELE